MRKWLITMCAVLPFLLLPQSVLAEEMAVSSLLTASQAAGASVSSELKVNPSVTDAQAAERLYYLGLMSGVGIRDGAVDFALDRPLTRLESLVMAVRLVGIETEVLETNSPHPFTDVPAWGSPYVGYFYNNGLILTEGEELSPDAAVSSSMFMKYMLNALGYSLSGDSYAIADAGLIGQHIGICDDVCDSITRGMAAQMMYRTLNTSCSGTGEPLSLRLVKEGLILYKDAQFLLWSEDSTETDTYIASCKYSTVKHLPEGKYTITVTDKRECLNVLADGSNKDYEGVGVSVWKRTDDITQKFRVEKTDSGTYRLYSAASGGGFNRLLGFGYLGTAGLFGVESRYAGEFIIQYADENDGSWYILSADDRTMALSVPESGSRGGLSLKPFGTEGYTQRWSFEFDGVVNEEGYELAIFPGAEMTITQGYYDSYSHQKQNALDITVRNGSVYAPFTGTIVRVDRGYSRYNTVWLQSNDKVIYADGSVDYMTVVFLHDNNISDLAVGQVVSQGEYFYDAGIAGGATGPHVHIACVRGKYKTSMSLTGSGDVYPEDALFVTADTVVYAAYGLDWVYLD